MEVKIGMIAAVSEALRYKKEHPKANDEEIIQHITDIATMERDKIKKMGMIAAASKAVSYIERNPNATEKEVIKQVMQESGEIASKIDLEGAG